MFYTCNGSGRHELDSELLGTKSDPPNSLNYLDLTSCRLTVTVQEIEFLCHESDSIHNELNIHG